MRGKTIYIAAAAAAGILASLSFSLPVLISSAGFFFYLFWKEGRTLTLAAFSAFLLFLVTSSITASHNVTALSLETNQFTGTVSSLPEIDGDRLMFSLSVTGYEKVIVKHRIRTEQEKKMWSELSYGDGCSFTAKLVKSDNPRNEHSFDYAKYLKHRKIHWIAETERLNPSDCLKASRDGIGAVIRFRGTILDEIAHNFNKGDEGVVQALVLGERSLIDDDLYHSYQKLGIMHLLVISGLHVGSIVSLLYFTMIRMGVTREKTAVSLIAALGVYAIITGGSPAVLRAAGMSAAVLVSTLMRRRMAASDGISLIFMFMVLLHPYYLYEAGFQLSFLVSYALIFSSPILKKGSSAGVQLILVTMIAQASSLPVLLYHFYQFSLLSIPVNLIFVPVIMFAVLPLANAAVLSMQVPVLFDVFERLLSSILALSSKLLQVVAGLDFGLLVFGKSDKYIAGAAICITATVFILFETKKVMYGTVLFLSWWSIIYYLPVFSGEGEVVFIDVGQGDSTFITLPHSEMNILIDTGGVLRFEVPEWAERRSNFDPGADIVVPLLKAKGIKKIDYLVLTHSDIDHIGGAEAVVRNMNVKNILIGSGARRNAMLTKVIKSAHEKGIQVYGVDGTVEIGTNAHPVSAYYSPASGHLNENNRSIAVHALLGGKSWLFTGDLEKEGESALIRAKPSLRADILKAGHHGSKTSSSEAFLKKVNPKIAVISAGNENRFGHPHDEVLDRFSSMGTLVFRTDEQGAVHYRFKSNKGTFFLPMHIVD
ncbi:DNA internalization-related competence protein ComEC/Rec2 [Bacillus marinisedimentorum]|uniref:DNA internalization-related competence protein ComEC/Rec2 n=1 Tax=Bacillus marinisedimentorum TaxID=1821260 RepID=UPI00087219DE|nr:DNA internalization-related competence protein ComEC/Rec2 [Bacillus marinisedimentorum]